MLQTITNDFSAVRLMDLGSGSSRGPFLVTQVGVAPNDDKARERMFVLRPDGKWVDFNCYACQGRPEVMDELVFNTTAEVMQIMARLTGKPEVVDLPIDEAGLKAWSCTADERRSGASRARMGAAIPGTPSSTAKEMTSVNQAREPTAVSCTSRTKHRLP